MESYPGRSISINDPMEANITFKESMGIFVYDMKTIKINHVM